jgi:hypothetical protein
VGTELSTRPTSTDAYNDHEFRVPHGRYGSMWYRDPLPGCDIAPADDTDRVSVSIVKKASGSDWSNVAIKRIAAVLEATPGRFAGLDATEIGAEMRKINAEGLKSAANRGTNVHTIAEQLLTGVPVTITADMPGGEYRGAVEAFFAQYEPTLVLYEFVCMNRTLNGHGFGGTADAIVEIKGKRYVIDYKSRGEDSRHGAYAQEAAQVGGYSLADYIVVDRQRRLIPELDGALIVSIKPDGYAVYPVDLPKAQAHFVDLHAWWVSRQTEHETYGRMWPKSKKAKDLAPSVPLAPVEQTPEVGPARPTSGENATTDSPPSVVGQTAGPVATPDPAVELANSIADWGGPLKAMLAAEWPSGVPTPGKVRKGEATWTPEQLVRAQAAINEIVGPFPETVGAPQPLRTTDTTGHEGTVEHNGPIVSDDVLDELLATIKGSPVRSIVNGWLSEASAAGVSWQPRITRRLRQVEIARAAYWLASIIADAPDDATDADFVELVQHIIATNAAGMTDVDMAQPIGVLLGALTIGEAHAVCGAAQALIEGRSLITFSDQGRVVLTDSAAIPAA